MSENKNNKNQKPEKQTSDKKKVSEKQATEKKKLGKKEILIIVFAAVAFIGITLGIVLGIMYENKRSFDYNTADLSKYVSLDSKYYNGYKVTIDIPEITDEDVEEEFLKLLCANKIIPDGPVYNVPGVTISVGDIANIYYRGYTMENGVKTYFDGGCNFADTYDELEIGSASFIPGFEAGLIGKNQNDYATLLKRESGVVAETDLISIKYSVLYADGTSKRDQTVLLDLSDPTLDDRWGVGFAEYFIGQKIDPDTVIATGTSTDKALTVPTKSTSANAAKNDSYFDITISLACSASEGETLIVEGKFPSDYKAEDLRGKTAYFEVYIVSVKDYDVPELNDAFITDTLKVSADDLADDEGANLVEKYKAKIKADLNKERDDNIVSAIENAFWDQALANAKFKQLPQIELDKYYDSAVSDITDLFESGYSSYYNNDFDAFARAYLDLSSTGDWQATLRKEAETSVKQRLLFYYIVREANLTPTEAEYNAVYEEVFAEHLQEYLDYYNITEDLEDYETELEKAKSVVKETYGDSYWDELIIYEYAMEKIVDLADVIYK